jgi:hypothetical protein
VTLGGLLVFVCLCILALNTAYQRVSRSTGLGFRSGAAAKGRILLVALTHTKNHLKAKACNATWGRAARERHSHLVTGPLWFSNDLGDVPGFTPIVTPSLNGKHNYSDVFPRVLGMLQYVLDMPGAVEGHAWVARVWDDNWLSSDALAAEAAHYNANEPLAIGMLGTWDASNGMPHILWGGAALLLSRGALRRLRNGGIEWCYRQTLRTAGPSPNLAAEDVWLSQCLHHAGVEMLFGEGLIQGSPRDVGIFPHHAQWLACKRRLVYDEAGRSLQLEGEGDTGGNAGARPISFHYLDEGMLNETYTALYDTPCKDFHQEDLDAKAGWEPLPSRGSF